MIDYIVEDVLNVMHLTDVQHSIVGNVEETRGISGGQRKRVNIGCLVNSRVNLYPSLIRGLKLLVGRFSGWTRVTQAL